MPDRLPVLDSKFWEVWRELEFPEIGVAVAEAFFGEDVPAAALREIVEGTVTFDAPVVTLGPGDHILELFHGPTLALPQIRRAATHEKAGHPTCNDKMPGPSSIPRKV